MPNITINFAPEMRQAIYEGRKFCTTRTEARGRAGDMFVIGSRNYRIIDVQKNRLGEIRDMLFHQEGFDSPEAFEAFWRTHNRGEFPVEQVCYVHWFARVEQEADAR